MFSGLLYLKRPHINDPQNIEKKLLSVSSRGHNITKCYLNSSNHTRNIVFKHLALLVCSGQTPWIPDFSFNCLRVYAPIENRDKKADTMSLTRLDHVSLRLSNNSEQRTLSFRFRIPHLLLDS